MTGEVKEYVTHRFREAFTVHVIELAIVGTRIDDNIVTVQELLFCNRIQFFNQARLVCSARQQYPCDPCIVLFQKRVMKLLLACQVFPGCGCQSFLGTRIFYKCFLYIMDEAQKWFSEGVALYEKGDYRRAITAFDKAIAIDPTVAEVWNNRGLALIQTEQYQEALRSINKALFLHPGYDNARKAKRIVLDLLKEPEQADAAPETAGSPPPQDPAAPERKRSKTFTAVVIVIMVIAAGGLLVVKNMQNPAGSSCTRPPPRSQRPSRRPCRQRSRPPSRHQRSRLCPLQGSGWRSSMTRTIQGP